LAIALLLLATLIAISSRPKRRRRLIYVRYLPRPATPPLSLAGYEIVERKPSAAA
jgi:hypothetical protein